MLLVPTYLAPSAIHGTGLFTPEPIAKGTPLWQYQAGFDTRIRRSTLELLPDFQREALLHYCYVNPRDDRFIIVPIDDARFWNFPPRSSSNPPVRLGPNTIEQGPFLLGVEATIIAARDIAAHEELTIGPETDADATRKLSES